MLLSVPWRKSPVQGGLGVIEGVLEGVLEEVFEGVFEGCLRRSGRTGIWIRVRIRLE